MQVYFPLELYANISKFNISAFIYKLFPEDFSSVIETFYFDVFELLYLHYLQTVSWRNLHETVCK